MVVLDCRGNRWAEAQKPWLTRGPSQDCPPFALATAALPTTMNKVGFLI